MNLPNRLSLIRIVLSFIFMAFLFLPSLAGRILALIIFVLAMLTDIYDGRLARARNIATSLGSLLDPLADKILISAAFISFVELKEVYIPAWMVVIIITREFSITGLRLLAAGQGRILPAEKEGKHKTISQMIAVFSILIYLIIRSLGLSGGWWNEILDSRGNLSIYLIMLVTVILTLISGWLYLTRYREIWWK